jgi:hypothetical protein
MLNESCVRAAKDPHEETAVKPPAIGSVAEETPFPDEPAGHRGFRRAPEGPSAFEFFADENTAETLDGPGLTGILAVGTLRALAIDAPQAAAAQVGTFAKIRPSVLAVFFVIAAIAAFATVRACQVRGVSPVAVWQLLGR